MLDGKGIAVKAHRECESIMPLLELKGWPMLLMLRACEGSRPPVACRLPASGKSGAGLRGMKGIPGMCGAI